MVANMANPLARPVESETGALDLLHPPGIAIQFRYAFGVDRQGLKVLDATSLSRVVPGANVSLEDAPNICVARKYARVADGKQGLVIVEPGQSLHSERLND